MKRNQHKKLKLGMKLLSFLNKYKGAPLCAVVVLLSYMLTLIFYPIVSKNEILGSLVGAINDSWYMDCFFNKKNKSNQIIKNDDIYIIDIKDSYSSRDSIANVIKKVSQQKPRLICVDFEFSDNITYDSAKTKYLKKTLLEVKDSTKLAIVAYKGFSNDLPKNSFIDSLNIDFGLSDELTYPEYTAYISGSYPRISTKIVEMLGVDTKTLPDRFVVNYRNKAYRKIPIRHTSNLIQITDKLTDKIILIGEYDSPQDIHPLSFNYKGRKQVPGIEMIANEVCSLLSYNKNQKYYSPYTYYGWMYNFFFYLLLSIIYVVVLHLFSFIRIKLPFKMMLRFVILLLAEYGLILLFMCVTEKCMMIPNIVLFVSSIFLINPIYEILFTLNHKQNEAKN